MTQENKGGSLSFDNLGIAPNLLKVLTELGFTVPTPIQVKSIPTLIEGKDVVGIAQTGTGKTLAYGIPMLQLLAQNKGRGLILLPTRELAIQVNENLKTIGQKFGLKTAVLIGGEPKYLQLKDLRKNPQIIIATPGRMIDHLKARSVSLVNNKILVLDEADLMLDMGFMPQIQEILKSAPTDRQTMLFSATMPAAIMKIVTTYMKLPVRIEVAPAGTPAEGVVQEMIVIRGEDKTMQLEKTLREIEGSVLIFARTKHGVKKLCGRLNQEGFNAAEIHSDRSLGQRRAALAGFKSGKFRVLVATDIAARGIDVKGIELVLNYDLPDSSEDYVHRIGRTGRAGKPGRAISFALPSQYRDIKQIEVLIQQNIPLTQLAEIQREKRSFSPRGKRSMLGSYSSGGRSVGSRSDYPKRSGVVRNAFVKSEVSKPGFARKESSRPDFVKKESSERPAFRKNSFSDDKVSYFKADRRGDKQDFAPQERKKAFSFDFDRGEEANFDKKERGFKKTSYGESREKSSFNLDRYGDGGLDFDKPRNEGKTSYSQYKSGERFQKDRVGAKPSFKDGKKTFGNNPYKVDRAPFGKFDKKPGASKKPFTKKGEGFKKTSGFKPTKMVGGSVKSYKSKTY